MSFTMPDVAATRASMLNAYRDGLRALVEDATKEVPSGQWEGVRVVTRVDLDNAISGLFGAPVPMPDPTWAEVHTPATVVVSLICPECELPTPSLIQIRSELLVSDDGKELRPKAKGKGKTHVCGQLALPGEPAEGQQSFDLADIIGPPPEADDDPEPDANDVDFGEGAPNAAGEAGDDEAEINEPGPELWVPEADGVVIPSPYRTDAHPLYAIVRDGESLDAALARIERLDDFTRIQGSLAGQALMDAIRDEGGAFVPFPTAAQTGGAS